MSLFNSWFGRKDDDAALLNFAFGVAGLDEVRRVMNEASKHDDEKLMRATVHLLTAQVAKDETHPQESEKPAIAALIFGSWLIHKKRFAEAEQVLKSGRGWKQNFISSITLYLDLRFALADAIWLQGSRERAEKEAFSSIEQVVNVVAASLTQWPMSNYRARLAKCRFDFLEQAQCEMKVFEEGLEDTPSAVEARRRNPQHYLRTAVAWYEAGHDALATQHLDKALELTRENNDHLTEVRLLVHKCYWLACSRDWEELPTLGKRAIELAGNDSRSQADARRIQAYIALCWGRLDEAEALYTIQDDKEGNTQKAVRLLALCGVAQYRGKFTEARSLGMQIAQLFPVATRVGSRMLALCHHTRVQTELLAHYYGQYGHLDRAEAALEQAKLLLRGDRKLEAWNGIYFVAVRAARGFHDEARTLAHNLEAQFEAWNDSRGTQLVLAQTLAQVFCELKEAQKAVLWCERSAQINPTPLHSITSRALLGQAYFIGGDKERARTLWQQVADSPFDTLAVRWVKQTLKENDSA